MYTVTTRQQTDGTFKTLDSAETLDDAIASAKCVVDGESNGYAVYVFCDQICMGKTYPYLVAKVTYQNDRYYTGPIVGFA